MPSRRARRPSGLRAPGASRPRWAGPCPNRSRRPPRWRCSDAATRLAQLGSARPAGASPPAGPGHPPRAGRAAARGPPR
ncbi:MAG: trehalase [Chloroflexi bacterium]|nr:MAG: trehalase [Chloroflexota bacterium]